MWSTKVAPSERPTAEPIPGSVNEAVLRALANRTDILAAHKNLEIDESQVKFAKNQTLPVFDVVAGYGLTGIGGTQIEREGLGGPIISTIPGGFGDALSSVFGNDFPTWTVGFNFSYPLFNRQAEAASARAQIN